MTKQPTTKQQSGKPPKPSKDFPLFAHANGQWSKKIRGRHVHFGLWADPDAALQKWLETKDDLLAGRTPRAASADPTVSVICNTFLTAKGALRDRGQLSPRTWQDYYAACEMVVDEFGKGRPVDDLRPEDFRKLVNRMGKKWGPVRLGNVIQYVRTLFKYGYEAGLYDKPIRFGPDFAKPSRKNMRIAKYAAGVKLFKAEEVRRLIKIAGVQLKAMILLGINCGFGNADVGRLPIEAVDLKADWIHFARPKTGIDRRCPLWPETVKALAAAIKGRTKPKAADDTALLFVTKYGGSWHKDDSDNPITKEFKKLVNEIGLQRGGFYWLRHTFRTIASAAKDEPAADFIMGHARDDMASVYREAIGDDRLEAVANHVRAWLFPKPAKGPAATSKASAKNRTGDTAKKAAKKAAKT